MGYLNEIITSTIDAGFTIERLLEPMPTDELKSVNLRIYERLCIRPQFLFIRAKRNVN